MAQPFAIRASTIHKLAMIATALTGQFGRQLDFKSFEFNRLHIHDLVAARRIELPSQPGRGRILAFRRRCLRSAASAKYVPKTKSPRFVSEAQKNRALWMRPRYMNVPSPAPCHLNVAGVGQESVWGLRIMACN